MQGQTSKFILKNKLSRTLRNNMTKEERTLWNVLRGRQFNGHKFRRQHAFDLYVLDFVCLEKKLVVEVDGGQHVEGSQHDAERTAFLENAGFRVLRFWNHEVMTQSEAVHARIWRALHDESETVQSDL